MAEMILEGDRARARCERCGAWREVKPETVGADSFFVHWRASLVCCGLEQTALATQEKDEIDIH